MRKTYTRIPLADRFWPKVDRSGDCWIWTASRDPKWGYGRIGLPGNSGGTALAHRVAWELTYGPIDPPDLCVLHRCDNPPCVRPDHLFLGTRADNVADMWCKGRAGHAEPRRGERCGTSKLTTVQVLEIRYLYATGIYQSVLAHRFGVTQANISEIVRRKSWAHI